MTTEQFIELISIGRESRRIEFKQSTSLDDKAFQATLIKSILAFSNVRDGGYILIGIEEDDKGLANLVGMQTEHSKTYSEDRLKSLISEFADPFVQLELNHIDCEGKSFWAVTVHEFLEIPVICKRDGPNKLRRGAIYTRTHRMPESAEIPSQTEMREILSMATEKQLRSYFAMQNRLGVSTSLQATSADLFAAELGGL